MGYRNIALNGSVTEVRTFYAGGPTPTGTVTTTSVVSNTSTWEESRPDRVRTRKPSGWLDPKGYSMLMQSRRGPVGNLRWLYPGNVGASLSGDLTPWVGGTFDEMGPLPFPAGDRAIIKALLALKDQHINLGVAFAEMQQTANLVGTTASRIGKAYTSFKRGRFRQGMQHLGASSRKVPQSWLEAQYAWKPLLGDVYGAMDALADSPRIDFLMTTKGQVSDRDEGQRIEYSDIANRKLAWERSSGAFVRLDYLPSNIFLDTLSRVGMTNPAEVIWEKVPFSFVVDWFLPVGDYLSSFDAAIGWTFKSGSISYLQKCKTKITDGPTSNNHYVGGKFSGSSRFVRVIRQPYTSSPLPKAPRFKNPLSLGHMANGLSLLATAFGR